MTAAPAIGTDMYAAGADRADAEPLTGPAVIRLSADADADVLLRIAAQLNLLNTAPARLSLERHRDTVAMVIAFERCTAQAIDLVCRKLAQLTCVLEVSTEPFRAGSAPNCS